jgi:hypothetical protein
MRAGSATKGKAKLQERLLEAFGSLGERLEKGPEAFREGNGGTGKGETAKAADAHVQAYREIEE